MARYAIRDADIVALSLVKEGANRKRFYLRKSDNAVIERERLTYPDGHPAAGLTITAGPKDEWYEPLEELSSHSRVVKAADWSAVYCVVAEPGWVEGQGVGDTTGEGDEDVWVDADEIRKAAHQFMRNGALINHMHETMEPFGAVVENAVAPVDFTVDGELIKAGSWYIAIEPTPEGKALIEKGELGGVSIQGSAVRQLVSKLKHERTIGSKGNGLFGLKGEQLPAKIQHVYNDLVESGHKTGSPTYRLAVGIVENWAEGHDGKGNKVSAKVQAEAVAAIAEFKRLAAKAKADNVKKGSTMHQKLIAMLQKAGVFSDDEVAELEKSGLTFAQIIGRLELSDELPAAMDALRESLYNAFYPYTPDGSTPDSAEVRASLEQSLSEFEAHMLQMFDGISSGSIRKSAEEIAAQVATLRPIDQSPQEDNMDATEIANIVKTAVADATKPLSDSVEALSTDVAALKKEADDAKAPTVADLAKSVGELNTGLQTVVKGLETLAAGESTVDGGGDPQVTQTAEALIGHVRKSVDPAFSGALLA